MGQAGEPWNNEELRRWSVRQFKMTLDLFLKSNPLGALWFFAPFVFDGLIVLI